MVTQSKQSTISNLQDFILQNSQFYSRTHFNTLHMECLKNSPMITFKCSTHKLQKNNVCFFERCCCNAFKFLSDRLHLVQLCSFNFSNFFWICSSSKNNLYFLFGINPLRGMLENFSLLCTM